MIKKIFIYLSFFIVQLFLFFFIIEFILLPFIANDKKEIYLIDVRGLSLSEAKNKLKDFNIEIYNKKYLKGLTPGEVISMSPRPFTKVKEGKVVKLTVVTSPERKIINNYINKSIRDVQLKLDRKYIEIDTIIYEFSNIIKKGNIIDQYPKVSDTLQSNQKITLIVSQGNHPNYYIVPYLINISLKKAKEKISRAGLFLGKISYEYNPNYLNNTVLDQNEPANKRLSFPAKIDLILSTDKNGK